MVNWGAAAGGPACCGVAGAGALEEGEEAVRENLRAPWGVETPPPTPEPPTPPPGRHPSQRDQDLLFRHPRYPGDFFRRLHQQSHNELLLWVLRDLRPVSPRPRAGVGEGLLALVGGAPHSGRPPARRYSAEAQALDHRCSCCKEERTSQREVVLHCPQGGSRSHTYTHIESCRCQDTVCELPPAPRHVPGRSRRSSPGGLRPGGA